VATAKGLAARTSKRQVARAVEVGDIVRHSRGRYSVPAVDAARRTAHQLHAVLSHASAALAHGWEIKEVPARPHVAVSRHRKLTKAQRKLAEVHRAELDDEDIDGHATSIRRTLADCLRLPFDEALAIADSALRHGAISGPELVSLAAALRGPRSVSARRVAAEASGLAANPFESVLRALALQAGLDVQPQMSIGDVEFLGRPDLVDVRRCLILEADSFEWHGSRKALVADARRYNAFVVAGWRVLRFTWDDVMHRQESVLETLRALADERTNPFGCPQCSA
jgi:very-short-patch-repair endonuclease